MAMLEALLWRDLLLGWRRRGDWLLPLLFLLGVTLLFPLAIGPGQGGLARVAPGVGWIAALLASLLAVERLFREDYEDGAQDLLLLAPLPLYACVQVRVLAHWLLTGLPISLLAVVPGLLLYLPSQAMGVLVVALLFGTVTFAQLGALGAALTVSLGRGGLLMVFLVLPMYVPVLVFGVSAVERAAGGWPATGPLALLAAMACLSTALAPLATAAVLRVMSD